MIQIIKPKTSQAKGLCVQVKVDQHFKAKVYTTGSKISGNVIITSPGVDFSFHDLEISFTGMEYTDLQFLQHSSSLSKHKFLDLKMPIGVEDLPHPPTFEADRVYEIAFQFIVPSELPMGSCHHECENPRVREEHMRPPPTVGFWEDDDQAPDTARIAYAVNARVVWKNGSGCTRSAEGEKKLKVLPCFAEDPPLDISMADEMYRTRATKAISKNLLSKSGRLTCAAESTRPVYLKADSHGSLPSSLCINLVFDDVSSGCPPPQFKSISAKIESITYASNTYMYRFPNLGSSVADRSHPFITFSTCHRLAMDSRVQVDWTSHDVPGINRITSGGSSRSAATTNSSTKWTAIVDVPFTLPDGNKQLFLPTFHSCLMSRVYVIHLSLSINKLQPAISFAIPLQIAVESTGLTTDNEPPPFGMCSPQPETNRLPSYSRIGGYQ